MIEYETTEAAVCLDRTIGFLTDHQHEHGFVHPPATSSRPHAWASNLERQKPSAAELAEYEQLIHEMRDRLEESNVAA